MLAGALLSCCKFALSAVIIIIIIAYLLTCSDVRPHCCLVCTRPFKREDDLAKHMKTHGPDVRPYQCDQCDERLESTSKLRRHMRMAHGDRFECRRCCPRVYFARRVLLDRHRREQHSGTK